MRRIALIGCLLAFGCGDDSPGDGDPDAATGADGSNPGTDGNTPGEDTGTVMPPPPPPDQNCGNGMREGTEACDDGNTDDGDGCSSRCGIERPEGSIFDAEHDWHQHLEPAEMLPPFTVGEEGSFRIKCNFSHLNYDDPIVYPGEQNRAHLHTWFGNSDGDFRTTTENVRDSRGSTCQGGPLNLTAYWIPTMLRPEYERNPDGSYVMEGGEYVRTGGYHIVWPLDEYQLGEDGTPLMDGAGNLLTTGNNGTDIYYKNGIEGEVTTLPTGLRMIAGDHRATARDPQDGEAVRYNCHDENHVLGQPMLSDTTIPICNAGMGEAVPWRMHMSVIFPSCWDGVNLDSPDHQSHMDYIEYHEPTATFRCPPSHPVLVPQVSYQLYYPVSPDTTGPHNDTRDWFLSSDHYEATDEMRGGASGHGDWFMAWDQETIDTWTQFCIRERRHCAFGDLGNGWRLSTLVPGRGNDTDIQVINRGAGPAAE